MKVTGLYLSVTLHSLAWQIAAILSESVGLHSEGRESDFLRIWRSDTKSQTRYSRAIKDQMNFKSYCRGGVIVFSEDLRHI
jgi:hypothetical protein